MLAGMRACLEFHAPGGVRFSVDFAPYMVTKRFTSAACQIRVCIVFCPMGDEQTRVRAVLGKKAEPRHAVHPMGAGHGSGRAPKATKKKQRLIESNLLECTSLSGSAAECIARIRGVSAGALLRAVDHTNSGDHLVSPACEPEGRANARRYPLYLVLGAASCCGFESRYPKIVENHTRWTGPS